GSSQRGVAAHLTKPLLAVAFLASFGSSLLYGYNLAVVNSPAVYIKDFYNRTVLRRNGTGLSEETLTLMYSLTVSVFAIGGLVGSLLVGMLVTRFGRSLSASSTAGISLSVVPMYLGEIAPKSLRGFLGLVPCIFIGTGVFLAQVLGLHELLGKEEHWPLFLSVVVIPTFVQLMLLPWFPESPRYLLIEKDNVHATITALKWYRVNCNIQVEIEEMQEEQHSLSSVDTLSVWRLLLDEKVRWQVLSVVVINIGMQLSGIDAIWFYTNNIFENAGIPTEEIPYTTAGTGIIEIISALIGCFTIEKLGRRPLMIGGFTAMGLCSAGITIALILQPHLSFMRYISVCCVVGIIAGFCIGPAGVPFLVTAELFKQSHRPAAYIVGGSLNWLCNFTVGFVFPFLQMSLGSYCYLVFATICFSVAIYIYIVIPETKNKTFMEISQMFMRKQPVPDSQGLILRDQLPLKEMNSYGGVENASLEFNSSFS
uniref:Solute carrier family 2, facilitated glucose transporter member 5 n=1 Tax=Mola mola TaxID=94237 RepID=A0A3Q3W7K2_MOLML